MVGVVIQLAFHDGGAFEVAVGETVTLSEPGIVFARTRGTFASGRPPNLRVRLVAFDAHQHQAGYAPDRRSRLQVETPSGTIRDLLLDRADGVTVAGTTLFQAVPTGVALVLGLPGDDLRAIHLRTESERSAVAEVTLPGGGQARFTVAAERALDDRRGSGAVTIRYERDGLNSEVARGDTIELGNTTAHLVDLVRWSGFTYVRSPGIPAVFAGFALVLTACVMLTFPAGVARLDSRGGSTVATIWLNRGSAVVASAWPRWSDERPEIGGGGSESSSRRNQEEGSW
jgi:hypothetical protein